MANKTLMGRARTYNEYIDVIQAVQNGHVDAALMERYAAAAFFSTGNYDDLIIEREFDTGIAIGKNNKDKFFCNSTRFFYKNNFIRTRGWNLAKT